MKEAVEARAQMRAIEECTHDQVKVTVKDLLSKLKSEEFLTYVSDKGIIRAFRFSYQYGKPLFATQDGLFSGRIVNFLAFNESSQVLTDSMEEASPELYH